MILKTYKYRLYPTPSQSRKLDQTVETSRRWYNTYLNRWLQPDSIIPDQSNAIDWDRYAYVRNSPLNYSDPDGHNPLLTGLVGLAVGGAVGGVAYFATNYRSFDSSEYWTAVGAGAIAGGLIASGGILAAQAATAAPAAQAVLATLSSVASGAGAGGASSGLSYIAANANSFDTTHFSVNTAGGALVGGFSGYFPSTGWGLVGKGVANQVGSGALYLANCIIDGEPITHEGISVAVGMGTISGAFDMGFSSYMYDSGITKLPGYSTSLNLEIGNQAARYAAGGALTGGVAGLMATSFVNFGINKVQPRLKEVIAQ